MLTCPVCGEKTEGDNRNGRGLRCTACAARLDPALPVAQEQPPVVEVVKEAPRTGKPEYSGPAKKEVKPEIKGK